MVHYNEDTKCKKCGKDLKFKVVDYTYTHDMGSYEDSYKQVDRNLAKEVGLGFYCNDCYSSINDNNVKIIIEDANKYLENEVTKAIEDVELHYRNKIEQLLELKKYITNGIDFLKYKNTLSELSESELLYLLKNSYIYQPNYQNIEVGFCPFKLKNEVNELYKNLNKPKEI